MYSYVFMLCAISSLICKMFLDSFYDEKRKINHMTLLMLCSISTALYFLCNQSNHIFKIWCIFIFFTLSFTYTYSKEFKKNLKATIMYVSATFIIIFFENMSFSNKMVNVEIEKSLAVVFILTFYCLISLALVRAYKNKKLYTNNREYKSIFAISIYIMFMSLILLIYNSIFAYSSYGFLISNSIITLIAYFTITVISYISIRSIKYMSSKGELQYMTEYLNEQNARNQSMRDFKHDFKNHIHVIKSYMEMEMQDKSVSYINDINGFVDDATHNNITGNVNVDIAIDSKIKNIQKLGASVNIDASIPKDIEFEMFYIITILGNLLDNAYEALLNTEVKECFIVLNCISDNLYIMISNSHSNKLSTVNKKFITTKNDKSSEHGLGLGSVKKCVSKLNGTINIMPNKELFKVEIVIPMEKICSQTK